MRKFLILLSVAALMVGVAACGGDDDDSASSGGATTTAGGSGGCSGPADAYSKEVTSASDFTPIKADTLTVVTSLPGPGFWEGSDSDPTQVTSGFEYDIADAMRKAFGLSKLEVRNESFDSIVAGTITDYDLALSQISITCDRAKVATFSMPYFESNQGVLVNADSNVQVTTLAEAKKIKWGVQTGTTAIDLLDSIGTDQQPSVYQQLPDGYTALEAKQVDAFLIDTAINLGEAARSKGTFKVVVAVRAGGWPRPVRRRSCRRTRTNVGAVNAVLKQLKDSGELDQLATKDLTADPGNLPVISTK